MLFVKREPKEFFSIFEKLTTQKEQLPFLYNQYVYFINKQMEKPLFFTVIAEAPSRWKAWNRSISLVHVNKEKRTLFQSFTILQPYPLILPTWKLALSFLFNLARKRKTYILFSGNHKMFSLSFLFDEILSKKYDLKFAKAIDYWIPGFVGNRRSMILPVRTSVAHPPKFMSSWKMRAKTFGRKFRYNDKAYLKKIETYQFIRDCFYPECIILLNSSHLAYNAGKEGYRQKLPIIALASSDSTNYGFSGSHFVLPAAVNFTEHLYFYCFLFFIVIRYGKHQFTSQEHHKFVSNSNTVSNILLNTEKNKQGFPPYKKNFQKFIKLTVMYDKLKKQCNLLFFNTIGLPFALKLAKKNKSSLFGNQKQVSGNEVEDIKEFVEFPTKFAEAVLARENNRFTHQEDLRLITDIVGQERYKRELTEDIIKRNKIFSDKISNYMGCYTLYKSLKLFLSCFMLQLTHLKTSSFFVEQKNTPFSILKKNFLYNFAEKLIKIIIKQQHLLDITPRFVDWKFYNDIRGKLFEGKEKHVFWKKEVNFRFQSEILAGKMEEKVCLKLKWDDLFNKPKKVKFLNRKIAFFESTLRYKKQIVNTLLFSKKGKFVDSTSLKKSLCSDFCNYRDVKEGLSLIENMNLGGIIKTYIDVNNLYFTIPKKPADVKKQYGKTDKDGNSSSSITAAGKKKL